MMVDFSYVNPSGINAYRTAEEVFLSSFSRKSGCWEWTGKKFRNGYGCFCFRKRYLLAHRVAFELFNKQSIPEGMIVCHVCDNRRCVNPAHLVLGTQKFNMEDMVRKGRQNPVFGEKASNAVLTEKDVLKIRELRYKKKMMVKDIAKLFKVSAKQISVVSRGVQWKRL